MVQVWKKVMLCLIACLFVAGVTLVLMTTSPENAYAEEERPYICVNGERKESVALLQGQSATVEIKKGNGSYETILYRTDDKGGFSLEGNQIFVKENSRVGTFVVHASCWLNDAETFDREISVVITAKGGTEPVFITEEEEEERRMIVELPQDVEYVDATVAMQDNPTGENVRLHNGDVINEILPDAPHGISGLRFLYTEVGYVAEDANGQKSTQALSPEQSGIEEPVYATNALTGSGTADYPYLIYNHTDFKSIYNYDGTGKYFRQEQAFSMTSSFTVRNFSGIYLGNNKTITVSNFSNQYSLMFKENHGTIQNVSVYSNGGVTITKFACLGVICTYNYGAINGVSVGGCVGSMVLDSGSIAIDMSAGLMSGGICGYNDGGSLYNCHVNGNIRMSALLSGGVAAANAGSISTCGVGAGFFFYGLFSSLTTIGGIVGSNVETGTIMNTSGGQIRFIYMSEPTNSVNPSIGYYVGTNDYSGLASVPSGLSGGICPESTAFVNNWYIPALVSLQYIDCNKNPGVGDGDGIGMDWDN